MSEDRELILPTPYPSWIDETGIIQEIETADLMTVPGLKCNETFGIELFDGTMARLIEKGSPVPSSVRASYTIDKPPSGDTSAIRFNLYRGRYRRCSRNTFLGSVEIAVPAYALPYGVKYRVILTLNVDETLRVTAFEETAMNPARLKAC